MPPSKHKMAVFVQICKLIPRNLLVKLARKHGVDKRSRAFDPWSPVVELVYAQLSHVISLNDWLKNATMLPSGACPSIVASGVERQSDLKRWMPPFFQPHFLSLLSVLNFLLP